MDAVVGDVAGLTTRLEALEERGGDRENDKSAKGKRAATHGRGNRFLTFFRAAKSFEKFGQLKNVVDTIFLGQR